MSGLETGSVLQDTDPAALEDRLAVGTTQLDIALQRLRDEAFSVDPQGAVARFNSAF